jgi:hypothetical protein
MDHNIIIIRQRFGPRLFDAQDIGGSAPLAADVVHSAHSGRGQPVALAVVFGGRGTKR